MSGGSPVGGGGFMRQRYSQGYSSSGDEFEDDVSSRPRSSPPIPRARTWIDILENFLWLASAVFIIYFGDQRSNLISLLLHDDRIRRRPLYVGMIGFGINALIFIYISISAWSVRRLDEKWRLKRWEVTSATFLPFVTVIGLISFCSFFFALWPIWSFLAFPLLFTLFMASMVIIPYLVFEMFRPQSGEQLRTD